MAPIDLDAVDVTLLDDVDKRRLNAYHQDVYEKIAPHLNTEEAEWLKEMTRPL